MEANRKREVNKRKGIKRFVMSFFHVYRLFLIVLNENTRQYY